MKNLTTSKFITHSGPALGLAIALALCFPIHAQSAAPASGSKMNAGTMAERHETMQPQREKMMAEMKAQDTELNAQLARIKSAPEAQKVDLLVAVVTQMVEQRTATHARMDEMMADMPMDHGSMSSHPMMKGMEGKPTGTTEKNN